LQCRLLRTYVRASVVIGLHNAFWFLAALLACVPIFGKYVTVKSSLNEVVGQSL
jgi:hypothetical protein